MNEKPKISVVIPAYNAEKYLLATLESIKAQTYLPHEIILVDDGSRDKTVEIAQSFGIRVIEQANQGPATARNRGIFASQGDWVAFVDADDLWSPDKIQKTADYIIKNPQVDMISTSMFVGNEVTGWDQLDLSCKFNNSKPFFRQLYRRSFIATSTVVLRKSILVDAGGFNTNFKGPEDFDLWLRVALMNKTLHVMSDYLTYYRVHPNSLTADLKKPYADTKKVLSKYRKEASLSLFATRIAILNIVTMLNQIKLKQYPSALKFGFLTIKDLIVSPYEYYIY